MSARAVIATVAVAVVAGTGLAACGSSSAGAAVRLEPANSAGTDPFTASVAIGPAVAFPANVQAIAASTRKTLRADPTTHVLIASGTAPGLYGGSGNSHVCDAQQLVTFLGQNPAKAAAWASVLGIAPNDITNYVESLTPVVLTSDTLVTNHGFASGHATRLQSVLQAGTAVMVDASGTPRVKCNCGNPLTPAEPISVTRTAGTAWPRYDPAQVTVVQSGPTVVNVTLINITSGDTYAQPVGSDSTGGQFVAATIDSTYRHTTVSTSADGSSWHTTATLAGSVSGFAWGNGEWLAVSDQSSGTSEVLESTDLRAWHRVASIPAALVDIAYGGGRWIAVGTEADREIGHGVVYASSDGTTWTRVAAIEQAAGLGSVAYGNGTWIAVNQPHQGGDGSTVFRSTDGTTWSALNNAGIMSIGSGQLAFGSGRWALGGVVANVNGPSTDGVVSISRDATSWTAVAGGPFAQDPIKGVAYGNGEWMAAGLASTIYTSPDGKTWTTRGHVNGADFDLAFGGSDTATSTPSPAATTTTPTVAAANLSNIDWNNYTYKDLFCGTNKNIRLTNGTFVGPASQQCGEQFVAVDFADVTGDGVTDAIVNLEGSAAGTAATAAVYSAVFTSGPGGPVNRGYLAGASFPPYSSGGITTWVQHFVGSDPLCCPSQYEKDTYMYVSGTGVFTRTGTTLVPASELPKR